MKAYVYINLYRFNHLRLNQFNLLTVRGIYAERLPRRFIFFFRNTRFCILIRSVIENVNLKRRSQFKLQAFDKYVHSNEGMAY